MEFKELQIKSPANEYPYIKRFCVEIKLSEFKEKLELIAGISKDFMLLELRDKDGKFLSTLTNDQATLAALGLDDGMQVYVTDASGNVNFLKDVSVTEKYVLPEEKYSERVDSVRAWKRREQLTSKPNVVEESEKAAQNIKLGDHCVVQLHNQMRKNGTVSFVGVTQFKPGWWVGVTYDEPVGKHDGSIDGIRYFTCAEKHGSFVRPQEVQIVDLTDDVVMEEI